MRKHHALILLAASLLLVAADGSGSFAEQAAPPTGPAKTWKSPLVKLGYVGSPLVETTPFVFHDRLYLLENYQAHVDSASKSVDADRHLDNVRIRDVEAGTIVSVALKVHSFSTLFVWNDRAYVFGAKRIEGDPLRRNDSISMTSSADLLHWTEPVTVFRAVDGEHIFNTAVCRGPDRFILLYETDDARWPAFTFKYCQSDDLVRWQLIPDALYGTDRYVGGPALYHEGDWYYTLYLEALPEECFETRIARSQDLIHWIDAPADRPFVTFDRSHKNLPLRPPALEEKNASDAELCYFRGKTIVYFTGGDQQVAGDLQTAEFSGTPRELLESFFAPAPATK